MVIVLLVAVVVLTVLLAWATAIALGMYYGRDERPVVVHVYVEPPAVPNLVDLASRRRDSSSEIAGFPLPQARRRQVVRGVASTKGARRPIMAVAASRPDGEGAS